MPAIIQAAMISAAGVTIVELVLALTGIIAHPTLGYLAWLSLPIVIFAAIRGIRGSAREGRDYAGQLVAGAEIGVLAGLLAAALTWWIHHEIAPTALAEARALAEAQVLAAGGSADAVADSVGLASPFGRALLRFIEVMITAFVCALATARRPSQKQF
ncbi:MAG TPA: hypothetical protein ENJ18_09205 [Nannocystis exedens]|nr:hypothetical protein [Nannocystis exedens]